jgi:ATP-binding cassette subfamily C protein LapB
MASTLSSEETQAVPRGPRRLRDIAQWLAGPVRANRPIYLRVALAAAFINLFALATSLFTMTVYDRVLPNNATESLIALSIGLGIVIIFDFALKLLRGYFTDFAGARIDREIGDEVFEQLASMRLDKRVGSTGRLAGIMRELEALRDFFASVTITAIVDVPFIVLILVVIALIGGPVVLVPLCIIPLVLIAGWLTYPAMDRLGAQSLQEGLHKQTVLVETIGALETVKAVGSAPILRGRWNNAVSGHAAISLRHRLTSLVATTFAQSAQMISYAGVVIVGVTLIAEREMSLGGLIACSILAGRAVAPLTQITSLLSRISTTRSAYREIDNVMQVERETLDDEQALSPQSLKGAVAFERVSFAYPGTEVPALDDVSFSIEPGERVAVIGRVGSGKSTLARLLLGLYPPASGNVMVDGIDLRQFDKLQLRRLVGTALQESVLFSGTVRENITLGREDIDDDAMIAAARIAGADAFLSRLSNGYDRRLIDRGESLSGGQRQAIALARALAGDPQVLVLDEPSSQMDNETEGAVIAAIEKETRGRTMIVITHRTPFLSIVDRVILMDKGQIVADGPRDEIMERLRGPRPTGGPTVSGDKAGLVTTASLPKGPRK